MKRIRHDAASAPPAAFVLTLAAAFAAEVRADDWTCADSYWEVANCWADFTSPHSGDDAAIGAVNGTDTTVRYDGFTGTRTARSLWVGSAVEVTPLESDGTTVRVTLLQTGGRLNLNEYLRIGHGRTWDTPSYQLAGGTLNVGGEEVILGPLAEGYGWLVVTGGELIAPILRVGHEGTGRVDHTGGLVDVDDLVLGSNAGLDDVATSHYLLGGGGVLLTEGTFLAGNGFIPGDRVFTQAGGTHTTAWLRLTNVDSRYELSAGTLSTALSTIELGLMVQSGGSHSTSRLVSSWEYELSGGTLSTGASEVDFGRFEQTGGSHISADLSIHEGAVYGLEGGRLEVTNAIAFKAPRYGGGPPTAILEIRGGSLSAPGIVDTGDGTSLLRLEGPTFTLGDGTGALSVDRFEIGLDSFGEYVQNGGAHTVHDTLTLGASAQAAGFYVLNGGSLETGREVIAGNESLFTQWTGTHVTGELLVGGSGIGTYALYGGSLVATAGTEIRVGGTFHAWGSTLLSPSLTVDGGLFDLDGGNATLAATTLGGPAGGRFEHRGGLHSTGPLLLAASAGDSGEYWLADTLLPRTLRATSVTIGGGGSGHFVMDGGDLDAGAELGLAAGGDSSGVLHLNGGMLIADAATVGVGGAGEFILSGGAADISGTLRMARHASSSGVLHLRGGTLSAAALDSGAGASWVIVDGGTLALGGGSGNLTADTFEVGRDAPFAQYVQSGGTTTVRGTLEVGATPGAHGSYVLQGGALETLAARVGGQGSEFTNLGTHHTGSLTLAGQGTGSYAVLGTLLVDDLLEIRDGGLLYQPGGTLEVASGGRIRLAGGELVQFGGALDYEFFEHTSGTLASGRHYNVGFYDYRGGAVTGEFVNEATLAVNGAMRIDLGLENNGAVLPLTPGRMLTIDGLGLVNHGTLNLAGGVLGGTGPLVNAGLLDGFGTVAGSGSFVNEALVRQGAGNLVLTNTGANVNAGALDLAAGRQLRLNDFDVELTNVGALALNGATVTGPGRLVNAAGGLVAGRGTIASAFDNAGSLLVASGGTTRVSQAFSSAGVITLAGAGASLAGGELSNLGTIEGVGQVGNRLHNASGGTIEARGGTLILAELVANHGTLAVAGGEKLLLGGAAGANDGLVALTGGTFDSNGHTFLNRGQVNGHGTVRSGGFVNQAAGVLGLSGGVSDIFGDVTNAGAIRVTGNSLVSFYDAVAHNGSELRIGTGSLAAFLGNYSGAGPISGLGTVLFDGTVNGGNSPALITIEGDAVFGDSGALVIELGGLTPGEEFDRWEIGGAVTLDGALEVTLIDGFIPDIGALFLFMLGGGGITGGFDSMQLPVVPGLSFAVEQLAGSLSLSVTAAPVPLPAAIWLFGAALAALGVLTRRQPLRPGTGSARRASVPGRAPMPQAAFITALTSRNSSKPNSPHSRPLPDCL